MSLGLVSHRLILEYSWSGNKIKTKEINNKKPPQTDKILKEMDKKGWRICEMRQKLVECCHLDACGTARVRPSVIHGQDPPWGILREQQTAQCTATAAFILSPSAQGCATRSPWALPCWHRGTQGIPGSSLGFSSFSGTLKDFSNGFKKHQSHFEAQVSVPFTDVFGKFLAIPEWDLCSL